MEIEQSPGAAARLPHADLATPRDMAADCAVVETNLRLGPAATRSIHASPIHVGGRPREVTEAAARMANSLHLHLD